MIGNPTAEQVVQAERLIGMGFTATEVAERVEISFDDAIQIASERSYEWELVDLEWVDLAE